MSVRLCVCVLALAAPSVALVAKVRQSTSAPVAAMIFAHVAAGGGFSTTFMLGNTGDTAAVGTLFLTDQSGNPLTVTMKEAISPPLASRSGAPASQTASSFSMSLPPGGSLVLTAERPGEPETKSGWARVESSGGSLGGVATFQRVAGGSLKTVAGVLAGQPLEMAAVPVDNDDSQGRFAGFAVANIGASDIRLTLATLSEDGAVIDTVLPNELNPLGPQKQIARFLHQYLPSRLKFRGSMLLSSRPGEKFAIVALQQNSGLLTAIPVIEKKSSWNLVWSDEFDGPDNSGVDAGKWVMETGGGGWGNNELETYTDRVDNAYIENGSLVIKAIQETYTGKDGIRRNYTSARLKTQGKFSQRYGRFEARIKVPQGQGIWPAFWMLGDDIASAGWPVCGEIDIFENIGREPSIVHGTIHGPGYSGANGITAAFNLTGGRKFAGDYHIFEIEWEPEVIRWKVDGNLYQTRTPADLPVGTRWVFDHPFFLLLNVAVGGNWPGNPDSTTIFPQKMYVDYVRVYERGP